MMDYQKTNATPHNKHSGAAIVEVIRMYYICGQGTEDDPIEERVKYMTKDGREIAQFNINSDPMSYLL